MENKHRKYMELVIELARKGLGKVSPNPMVGCVIVKNGVIIGKGYHCYFGGPHAEAESLKSAGERANQATMYVNLEPCCHTDKKTPPCVPKIINAGIKEVIVAMKDPNPEVSGKGIKTLRHYGIKCKVGLLQKNAEELNRAYIKWITKKMPFVILKSAVSLDGKISTRTGDSKWITSRQSREVVYRLRSQVDSVLVGANTIIKDNPSLTAHRMGRNPVRIVIDPKLKIPLSAKIFNTNLSQTILITKEQNKQSAYLKRLESRGVRLLKFLTKNGRINFKQIMYELAKDNIASVLVEGGGETNALALEDGVVDEVMFFIAPKIIGGRAAKTPVEGEGIDRISQAINFKFTEIERLGSDVLVHGKLI